MIHELHNQGLTISAIARRTGLDRKTVRKYLELGPEAPCYGPRAPRESLLAPFHEYLSQRVVAYPELTATRLLREIRALGYGGGYSILTDYLRAVRPAQPQGFEHRFETPPGRQAQVDFAHFKVAFSDEPDQTRVVWLFSLVLAHCRYLFARFVAHQDLHTLVRCHLQAFAELGGVPRQILYDRMRTAVLGEDETGQVIYNPTLLDLARHYGFRPKACRPYRAKTKGKVERPFRYVRQDFFLAGSFRNLEDLNAQLDRWRHELANARTHGTTGQVVREAFLAEQPALRPLPERPYNAVLKLERRISRDGMVSVAGNEYSVPDTARRRLVEVHVTATELFLYEAGQLIAVHPVLEGSGQRRIAAGHRRAHPPGNTRTPRVERETQMLAPGEQVTRRPLAVYAAIGEALAEGGQP